MKVARCTCVLYNQLTLQYLREYSLLLSVTLMDQAMPLLQAAGLCHIPAVNCNRNLQLTGTILSLSQQPEHTALAAHLEHEERNTTQARHFM